MVLYKPNIAKLRRICYFFSVKIFLSMPKDSISKSEKKTQEYLDRLYSSESFIEFKNNFIKKYKNKKRSDSNFNPSLTLDLMEFCKKNNLDIISFQYIAFSWIGDQARVHQDPHNLFVLPISVLDVAKEDKINYSDSLFPIALHISIYATKRDIIDFVEKHYADIIQPVQLSIPSEIAGNKGLKNIRSRNPIIQQRNDFIYKNRLEPYKSITKLVREKFKNVLPDDKTILDQGAIGKIISVENKRRHQV